MKPNATVMLVSMALLLGGVGMWLAHGQNHTLREQRAGCESDHNRVFIVDKSNNGHCAMKAPE